MTPPCVQSDQIFGCRLVACVHSHDASPRWRRSTVSILQVELRRDCASLCGGYAGIGQPKFHKLPVLQGRFVNRDVHKHRSGTNPAFYLSPQSTAPQFSSLQPEIHTAREPTGVPADPRSYTAASGLVERRGRRAGQQYRTACLPQVLRGTPQVHSNCAGSAHAR